jgi:type I restriction enzyme S subunit
MSAETKVVLGDMCAIIDCEHKTAPTPPVGNVAIVPRNEKVCLGQRTVLIRVKDLDVDANYLNYLLNTAAMNAYLNLLSTGATVGHLNVTDIRRLKLPQFPNKSSQRKIAAILSTYDDLIENNRRRMALLEKLAEEVYREWFVRLRFPGHEKVNLENRCLRSFVSEYIGGDWGEDVQSPKFGNPAYVIRGTDFENVQQGDISSVPLRFIKHSALSSRKLKAGDLIVENSVNHRSRTSGKSLLVTQHVLDLFNGDVICASFCKLIRPKETKHSKYLSLNFRLLFKQGLFDYFQNIATNGIANLQAERFMDRHLIPFSETIDLSIFDSLDASLLARSQAKLRQTRDLLLPRLISGKLSVEDLDIQFPPGMTEELKDVPASTVHA